jgi:hypothetical protein
MLSPRKVVPITNVVEINLMERSSDVIVSSAVGFDS